MAGDITAIGLSHTRSSHDYQLGYTAHWDNLVVRACSASPPSTTYLKPIGDFTANATGGNAPLAIQFTDMSFNHPAAWSWDFGDGTTSTEQHPVHTYAADGTYTVNLTVTNSYGSDSSVKTEYITVGSGVPIADITADVTSGYAPFAVQFTDTSTVNPRSWFWDFGDGSTSTEQHPMHTYTAPGAYTVSLTVANDYGNNTAVSHIYSGRNNYYQEIAFSASDRAAYRQDVTIHRTSGTAYEADSNGLKVWHVYVGDHCRADYGDVRFTDAAGAPLAYHLRPGSAASQAQFYVQLAEADQPGTLRILYGDTDVTTAGAGSVSCPSSDLPPTASAFSGELRTAASPSASFTSTPVYGLPHSIQFTDTSTNYPIAWLWDFGDGATSTERNPLHIYAADGNYTVSLTATNEYGSNTATKSAYEVVTLVVSSITVSPSPVQVNQSETQQFAAVAVDQMGNVIVNPSLTWSSSNETVGTIDAGGLFTALVPGTANVTASADGVETSVEVRVIGPVPDFLVSAVTSTTYPVSHNTVTATIENQGTADAGEFTVDVTIAGNTTRVTIPGLTMGNSTTVSVTDTARWKAGDTVPITVTVDPDDVVSEVNEANNEYSTTVTITTTGGDRYQGGRFSDGHDKVNTVFYDEGNIGVRIVRYGNYNSVSGSPTVRATFKAEDLQIPEGAKIKSARVCQAITWYGDPRFDIEFNGHEKQSAIIYMDCINGVNAFDVTPYFNATGDNTAVLTPTVNLTKCAYYATVLVVVYEHENEPNRQIWVNEGCDCLLYGFTDPTVAYTLIDNVSTEGLVSAKLTTVLPSGEAGDLKISLNNQVFRLYDVSEGDPSIHYYDVTGGVQGGENELGVIGHGDDYFNYALSVLEVTKVTDSEANFTAVTTSGPAPLAVKFTDTSTGTPTAWLWDFGDGTTSTEQHPTHTYTAEGNCTVSLTVSNSLGTDTETRTDYISVGALVLTPAAAFSATPTTGDAPLTVRFTDESTNTPTAWVWNFGDGKTSTEQNPSHTYETWGTYSVTLTATNYGGSDTVTKTDYISVTTDKPVPVPGFTTDASTGRVPFSAKFTDTTTGSTSSWAWDFGDGGTSTEQNPVHTYVTAGTYTVTLAATGPGGTNSTTVTDAITATPPLTSDNYNGGIPLTTVKEGTVSGGLWYDSYPGFATSAEKTFTLPDHTDIQWARLYVDVYCGHMEKNYRGNVTIGIDADGDGTYELQKGETFNTTYSFPGESGTGPVWLSDHMNRVTSDYVMWYDLTDAIEGQQVNVQAATRKIDASFDGRIKAMVLVVAYDDGDTDRVHYWANQGHDTVNPLDGTYTGSTTFATTPLAGVWDAANLSVIYLASVNGVYAFQGTSLTSGTPSGSYFGTEDWNVSSMLTAGQDSVLAYDKSGDYYKIPLALLSVRYVGSSGGDAPVTNFTANVTSGTAPLAVNFTDLSTNAPTSWTWDFGDNATSTKQNATHTYTAAGTYTVNLTATNAAGSDSEVKTGYITVSGSSMEPVLTTIEVSPAMANLTVGATQQFVATAKDQNGTGMAGVTFTWTSSNEAVGTVNATGYFTALAEGAAAVAAATGGVNGTAQVTVTGGSPGGDAPVANFIANTTTGDTPLAVQFTDESTNAPTSWLWDFGDNATSDEQHPVHTYTAAGTYTVTLTAANAAGSDTATKPGYITAGEPALLPDLTIAGTVNPIPASAVFAREPNPVKIRNIKNTGPGAAANIPVSLYASDVSTTVPVNTTTIDALASGAQITIDLIDPTIRNLEGGTIVYTAALDPDNLIPETNEANNNKSSAAKSVKYNGYKGKGIYWDGGSNITTKQTYDLRGGIVYAAQPDSAYKGVGWTDRTETWTAAALPVPAGATVEKVLLYVAYNWDQTPEGVPNMTATFNGNPLALGTPYMDKSNFGAYADYEYGLYPAVDVTNLFVRDGDNTLVMTPNAGNKQALYPSTLAVIYSDPTATRKQIFLNEECDELAYSEASYGTTLDEAIAYVPFSGMTVDPATVKNATLHLFVGSAGPDEGNLFFNGATVATGAWMGNANSCEALVADVTHLLAATGNEAGIQGTFSGGMCAYHQFLVVEYADAALPDLTVSTLAPNNGEVFSAAANTYTATITNIGTADASAFAVEFNVTGAAGTVPVAGLAAGANTSVTWTDETVRTAGDPVTVTVTADADGAIAEADEENNARTLEKTVVNNGYRGKRWTGGEDLTTAKTYDVRGDLVYSSGSSAYLSAGTGWTDYAVAWTAGDLAVPENATVAAARLYVPYTWDKGPVFPANVTLTFNGVAVEQAAFYTDEKLWGSSYPYGMTVYDVTDPFSADGNAAVLANAYPGGGTVSVRGMLLAVVYDDGTAAPHTVLMNEGFDLLYGGAAQSTTPEQATSYAPFTLDAKNAAGARLITVAPGAGPTEGDLLFNDERFENAWNYTGTSQIGVDERNVTALLAGENLAGFRSDADYMEAAAAFLVVEYPLPTGGIAITSTPAGAAVFLDGEETGEVTNCFLADVPAGDHVVTLKRDGYADASATVTVAEGETAVVHLALTTATGSLTVTSTPEGVAVLIDGADTGKVTDATLDGIAVGTHTVTVTKDGYRDTTAEVTIAYNETATIHLALVEARGSIAVTSAPEGAAIFLDGTDTGKLTNALLEDVPVGDHVVTVKKAGYADASKTVTVADNETATVSLILTVPAGSIRVASSPDGARIFLDDLETGEVTNATLTTVPVGTHTVRVELEGYRTAEAAVTVKADEAAEAAFTLEASAITLHPGWNFVSTPKRLADGADTVAIFDEIDTAGHSVLLYDGQDYKWRALGSTAAFQPLDGIWIYANASYTIPLTFAAGEPELPPTKDLGKGWNAIGFSDTVPEAAKVTLQSLGDHWSTLFGFDAAAQEYDVSIIRGAAGRHGDERPMQPMQGYWIYMNAPETLGAI